MKIAYTIHELVLNGERVSPNSVVELDAKAFAELDALGAVREATDDEAAIAGLKAAAAAAAKPAAVGKKASAAEKKAAAAAEKKVADVPAPAPDRDPDVVSDQNADTDLLGGN